MAILHARKIVQTAIALSLFAFSHLQANNYYEGIEMLRSQEGVAFHWLSHFLPYNPIIVDAGAFYGNDTIEAAQMWPQGAIHAFEPNPAAYSKLVASIESKQLTNISCYPLALNNYAGKAHLKVSLGPNGNEPAYSHSSSLLPLKKEMEIYTKGPEIEVPCDTLQGWCNKNAIDHIDILRLELEGLELPVLRVSTKILKNTKIVHIKTMSHPHRIGMTSYPELKKFLEQFNFVLISHWYQPQITGHAIFMSRELAEAYFTKSLGINISGA